MPTVKDVIVKKPSDEEAAVCKAWPTWQCEASTFDWEYTQKETCLLIEGKVTVTDGENSVSFGPGDMVVFPEELKCTWQVMLLHLLSSAAGKLGCTFLDLQLLNQPPQLLISDLRAEACEPDDPLIRIFQLRDNQFRLSLPSSRRDILPRLHSGK